MRIALLQLKCSKDKFANLRNATNKIAEVVRKHQAQVVALPECFNSPYGTKYFREYAEDIPNGITSQKLSECARNHHIYIVGGSIPEIENDNDRIYNTCTVWSPDGKILAKHRKMHLFDIDVKDGIRFKESEVLTSGNEFTIVKICDHKIGIGICYDIRFEEMARIYRNAGCEMLIYPAAFNMTTGPLHWELLQRSRANDNQLYVVTISPARDMSSDYIAYGFSMIVDPWARIIKSAKENEEVIFADIDFALVNQARQQIPIFNQRRTDLYKTCQTWNPYAIDFV